MTFLFAVTVEPGAKLRSTRKERKRKTVWFGVKSTVERTEKYRNEKQTTIRARDAENEKGCTL